MVTLLGYNAIFSSMEGRKLKALICSCGSIFEYLNAEAELTFWHPSSRQMPDIWEKLWISFDLNYDQVIPINTYIS